MTAQSSPRGSQTIRLPFHEEQYQEIVNDPQRFRQALDEAFAESPELFPDDFDQGYKLKDSRISKKMNLTVRRIELKNGQAYSICPSFVMPYMSGETKHVEHALLLRVFGVPFWVLAHIFGRDPMYYYRLETSLGRNSIVGTTVRTAKIPEHLLVDEHHQTRHGEKIYIATTVGEGCCLGASVSETADEEGLTKAYGVFKQEALNVQPDYAPKTVNMDGWKSTGCALKILFACVVILRCFLHAWLKIRSCGKHLKDKFSELSKKVWEAYRAPNRRSFSQRIRALKNWAKQNVTGVVQEKVLDLCKKREQWKIAFDHPEGHRTSNMLDRLMRWMNRWFDRGQHLHGSLETCEKRCRSWALLYNFRPWHPQTVKANDGWRCPAERLNKRRYHENWLQNLLVSASMNGYRKGRPQNA